MEIKELTNEEFNKFVNRYSLNSVYQSVEYGLTMNNQNFEVIFLGLVNEINDVIAASLILVEKLGLFKYAYAPRGFLIDYNDTELLKEFTTKIKKYLKKEGVIAIKISPLIAKSKYTPSLGITLNNPSYDVIYSNLKKLKYYHLGYNNFFEAFKPRFCCIANLEKDTNKMFNLLKDDVKEKIIQGDLLGIRIYKGNETNLNFIYEDLREKKEKSKEYVNDLYSYFSKSGKVDIYYAKLEPQIYLVNTRTEYQKQINICAAATDELFKNQGKANNEIIQRKIDEENKLQNLKNQLIYATNLLRTNPNGIVVATAMVIKHRGQIYIMLDGENEEYKQMNTKYILYWKLMESYAQQGYTEINLGGMTNPNCEEENKYKDVNDFKLSFNSSCIEYAGDFELITNATMYALYRNAAPFRKVLKKQD
jgi:lipid II:glycine glycyltransferase (peptidoglycan interpeptide bridge formation enzyme)